MKLKIIKKNIKEGVSAAGREYSIKSLLVVFSEAEVYEKIVAHLRAQGIPDASITKFCSPREYKGETSYSFFLSCSNFTFDAVESFGTLDAKVIFSYNDAGYVNAKIQVIDKVEQVISYEGPEEFVGGWACPVPATAPKKHDDDPLKPIQAVEPPILSTPASPAFQPPILSGFQQPMGAPSPAPTNPPFEFHANQDQSGLPF